METLWQDLRYGARMLAKSPGFTAVAVLTLALGIGANTALFSIVNAILLRPLPYRDSSRLVRIYSTNPAFKGMRLGAAYGDVSEIRARAHTIEQIAVFRPWSLNLTGQGEPEQVRTAQVSSEFLALLGVEPVRGRFFSADEHSPGRNDAVVISDGFWRVKFGADPDVLGRRVMLNGKSYAVIGIAPPWFVYPAFGGKYQTDLWLPLALTASDEQDHYAHQWQALARLRQGTTLAESNAELQTIATRMGKEFPRVESGWGMYANSLEVETVGNVRGELLILLGAVTFLLLIACANVMNLLLSRGWLRQKEMAVRTALGANRGRILRQLIAESNLLSLAGGALALLFAWWGVDAFRAVAPVDIPRLEQVRTDWTMVWFALAAAILVGTLAGLAPAFQVSRLDPNVTLKEGGPGSGSRGRMADRMRHSLMVAEVALIIPLLVGSVLLLRSFERLLHQPTGMRTDHLITMTVALPQARYAEDQQIANFTLQLLERLRALPGVESAASANTVLLQHSIGKMSALRVEGEPETSAGIGNIEYADVSPDFFRTLGVPLLEGREFTAHDQLGAPPVAIINQAMAKDLFRGRDPVGAQISFKTDEKGQPIWSEVVGVAGNVRDVGLELPEQPEVFVSVLQDPSPVINLVARTAVDPLSLVPSMRTQVWSLDPDQPVSDVKTMDTILSEEVADPRFRTALLATFAALGMVLGLVGIYGVVSYSVAARTHEIGVRMALGARPADVLRLVLGQGLKLTLLGVVVGTAAALVLTRLLQSLLYVVTPTDPITFIGVIALLLVVAMAACYVPARRAMRVDPMVALRYE